MRTRTSTREKRPGRMPLAAALVGAAAVLALLAPGLAMAGPGDGVVRRFSSPGVAIPGETITITSIQACTPGHKGNGTASLATAFDTNGNTRDVARTTFTINGNNTWTARLTIPAGTRPGTYMLGAICGGGPDGSVSTGYQLNYIQLSGECLKPFFVGLRGSGEDTSGNGMGDTLNTVYSKLRGQLGNAAVETVPRADQERYYAVQVGDWRYFTSVNSGKNLALDKVRTWVQACGDASRIVMAGYSQGAQAVVEALGAMTTRERSKVVGVALFGSPVHMPFVNGDAGPAHNFGITVLLTARRLLPVPDGVPNRMRDYCMFNDPVCDPAQGAPAVQLAEGLLCGKQAQCVHKTYARTYGDEAARYLAARLR